MNIFNLERFTQNIRVKCTVCVFNTQTARRIQIGIVDFSNNKIGFYCVPHDWNRAEIGTTFFVDFFRNFVDTRCVCVCLYWFWCRDIQVKYTMNVNCSHFHENLLHKFLFFAHMSLCACVFRNSIFSLDHMAVVIVVAVFSFP